MHTSSPPPTDHRSPSGRSRHRSIILLVAISLALVLISRGTPANAAPPTPVGYTLSSTSTSLTLTLQHGTFKRGQNSLAIVDNAGSAVFQMPLSYRFEDREYPIAAQISGNSVTLIPSHRVADSRSIDPQLVEPVRAAAGKQLVDAPTTRQERDNQALAQFMQILGAGTTIGTLVGTIIGAIVGGVIGCAIGLAAAVIGCLVAVVPAAGLGGVAGTIVGGGGTLVVAGIQYLQTINSPFVPPRTSSPQK